MKQPELGSIVAALNDSEINGEVSWFSNRVWHVRLGRPAQRV